MTLESSSPLMRRAGSRITAATTTGPASGAQPASSTPAKSGEAGQSPSLRRGSVAKKWFGSSIGKVMQRPEYVGAIRIQHGEIAAIQILPLAAFPQQAIGGKKTVLAQAGRVQQQRPGKGDVQHRVIETRQRFRAEAFQHVIRRHLRI